jgi:translation initiation factor IF-2
MNDTKDDKTLSVNTKKTLTLKRPGMEQGTVRQNFSHGRTKAVVVETKKRKFSLPGEKQDAPQPAVTLKPRAPQAPQPSAPAAAPRPAEAPSPRSGMVLNELSTEEMEARRRALQDSKVREVEERKRAVEDAQRRAEEDERRRREREESARRQAEEEARLQAEAEARRRAEEEAKRRAPAEEPVAVVADEEEKPRGGSAVRRGPVKPEVPAPKPVKKGEEDRRRGKLTLTSALSDEDARARSLSAMRRRQEKFKRSLHNEPREKI